MERTTKGIFDEHRDNHWTVKELFPNMKNEDRCKLGRKIHKSYKTLFAGKLPKLVKEKHGDYEIMVCLYPISVGRMNFKSYIKFKFG